MNEELFKDLVRPVTDKDREKLPVFSYSKMDTYKSCPYQYDLKYNQKKYTNDTSLALELGSLLHYVLEQKGKMLKTLLVDYQKLAQYMEAGVMEVDEKTKDYLLGIHDLRRKYFETWYAPDNASGMNYDEKLQVFDKVLKTEMEKSGEDDWEPVWFEYQFEFVWNDRAIIKGFIDRVDHKHGQYRTVDYKTSKKVYDSSKLATSLQFGVYALALYNDFGVLPVESQYRFILLDETQKALTKGWEKRLIKALNGLFDKIEENEKSGIWKPSASPLCHWCNFCEHNPDAHEFKSECEYYSLWKPDNKTFSVNKVFDPEEVTKQTIQEKRKLVF